MILSTRLGALPGYPLAELPAIKRKLIEQGVDLIDLGAGDADYPPPSPVIESMRAAVQEPGLSKYGFQQGLPEFRRAASAWMERRFGVRCDPVSELLPLLGSKEGLAHLPFAVLNPGEVAIVPEPGYQAYLGGTILAGAEPYIYRLEPRNGFLLDLEQVPEATLRRARLVFLNYPNNPTTAVASLEYLERLVAICRRYGIVIPYDNPYCDLTFDGYRAPSLLEVPGARDIAVEFFSLSKSFSMTGWRLGWAAGGADLIEGLAKVKSYVDTGPFLAIQKAAVVALENAEQFIAPTVAELARRRDAGVPALRAAGFRVENPRATMYLWVALPAGVASAPFARRALQEAGVVVLPGSAFGAGGEGYFRIALTVTPARLEQAIRRLSEVVARVQEEPVAQTA